MPAFATPAPPWPEVPQLDEGLWQAWVEKNEQQDRIKFARRVKVIAILIVLLGVVDLLRVSS
jgi:hypothetical protein